MKKIVLLSLGLLLAFVSKSQYATPAKTRMAEFNSVSDTRFQNIPHQSIGPTIMSGRVTDLEVNPNNPLEMFVAYASGGVFYTSNNGQSFKPIFDNQHSITIGDIAVDWRSFTVVVGTGECNSSRSSYAGTGVYKSNDTGNTWKHLGLEETHHISKVLIDPKNADIIYVASLGHLYTVNEERGIFKTTDGGLNWKKVLYVNETTGFSDLCFDPTNPDILMAASWERQRTAWNFKGSGPGSGVYITKDAGKSWTKIYNKPNTGRIGLAPFVQNNKTGVYLLIDDQTPLPQSIKDTAELTISDLISLEKEPLQKFLNLPKKKLNIFLIKNSFPDKMDADSIKKLISSKQFTIRDIIHYMGDANSNLFQASFKGSVLVKCESIETPEWKIINDSIKDFYYTYGYYFGQIRVSATNPNELYILGVVLGHSTDGGLTFHKTEDNNVHADHHALWANPANPAHLVNGNDGGLNISYDNGRHWVKCNSPAVGQFYTVTVDENEPYNVYGGMQDNGVWKGSRNYTSGNGWHQYGEYPYKFIMGGDGMQVAVDTKQDIVYTGYQFGNYYKLQNGKETYITPRHSLGELPYRFNWQTPILLSRHAQNTLYFGGNFLFRSFDQGKTWQKISSDLTAGGKAGNVPFGTLTTIDESPIKFGVIYTGSDDGMIYVTKDAGNTWNNISIPAVKGMWVSRVIASAHSLSTVYVTINGYRNDDFRPLVFVSNDYGKTWKSIQSNLPFEPINVIKEDPKNSSILYIGTDNGLYLSMDKGLNWEKVSSLPRVAVHDLAIQKKSNELVVATHGRSLFAVSLNEINYLDSQKLTQAIVLFPFKDHKVSLKWGESTYYWSAPNEREVSIAWYSPKLQPVDLIISDSLDRVVMIQKLISSKGINYYKYNFTANENTEVSKMLRKASNGKYYLKEGEYTLELISGGNRERQKFRMKNEL
jgi:photosystem II stability/assembly factor-like uncharacterized protein